ncbi:hypothetical protein EC973_002335 [Apophysomyces ossiformis]|uniref:Uncharacterized protein n=1 Tax=Apophysomyces ossiformis TaxID=679940 RepID=A0A8H7ENR6_9FUNG|nr:hypothetical protein EC973_002335 [Apophysomyces ossiformis]
MNNENDSNVVHHTIVDADNNSIPTEHLQLRKGRPGSIASISSEDSVNLEELINANFTEDVDDETDLPDLAGLELDDSTEDFWKMDNADNFGQNGKELDWSPEDHAGEFENANGSGGELTMQLFLRVDDRLETLSNASYASSHTTHTTHTRIRAPSSFTSSRYSTSPESSIRRQRSGSLSSENSMTSQSTITAGMNPYTRIGMTPMIYPSESTSTSSRSLSRLSNYSASSQASSNTSAIPRPRTGSAASSGMPTPSRSFTTRSSTKTGTDGKSNHTGDSHLLPRSSSRIGAHLTPSSAERSKLAKRASHIPAPPSVSTSKPTPQRTTSSASSRSSGVSTGSRSSSRIGQRASHIPSVPDNKNYSSSANGTSNSNTRRFTSTARPTSPMNAGAHGTTSRLGVRSSTPGPRNSIFSSQQEGSPRSGIPPPGVSKIAHNPGAARPPSRLRRPQTATDEVLDSSNANSTSSQRTSGIRAPGSVRSASRIGMAKRA